MSEEKAADLLEFATEFTFYPTRIDGDERDRHRWGIQVAYRGRGRWAVLHTGFCYGTDGQWDYEGLPSGREDEWLATHRFDRDEAIQHALALRDQITINGRTYDEWQTHFASREVS